ncbi:glutamate 5-kinase [Haloferula luteola]|uniref:Glutamate 5-kinase n=1 Tax=Haloferula luteola TaxID=595692 RepID=A0A840VA43_9BACT|nr:glutamate 5-kinase [Haloferula luteola]MBB5352434.1 glutamate 5-kinase [Haloferula luteola]
MNPLTVIKAGTGVLTRVSDGTLDGGSLVRLVTAIAGLLEEGHRCLLVSSGAVGAGVSAFGLEGYPSDLTTRQACAAVGQARLMHTYENLFRNFGLSVAQVLLSGDDLHRPERAANVRNTLDRLLSEPGIVPIINENDSVAVEELRVGDNDMLSAAVARLMGASRLILLTSVDGLLNPETHALVPEVSELDGIESLVKNEKGRFSIGGMATKLSAVRGAVEAGIEVHIAHGRKPERLAGILAGEKGISTRFPIKA